MWFDANNLGCVCVERKIHSGTDPNLKDPALRVSHNSLAIGSKLTVPHREIDQTRNNAVIVESHRFAGGCSAGFHRITCTSNLSTARAGIPLRAVPMTAIFPLTLYLGTGFMLIVAELGGKS